MPEAVPQPAGRDLSKLQAQLAHVNFVDRIRVPEGASEKEINELIFNVIAFDKLMSAFEDDLYDANFDERDVDRFNETIEKLSDEEISSILSLPARVRKDLFRRFRAAIDNGEQSVEDMVQFIVDDGKEHGYRLGHHVTLKDIHPSLSDEWSVVPTEFDDRDNMKMAYYSLDFEHIYRKKPARYLYFVRAETGPNTAHKIDDENHWGRAPYLSIAGVADIHEVDDLVRKIREELKEKRPDDVRPPVAS